MRLLDLFCGAGGAAMGYSRAGFEVVGVDTERQANYPYDFFQADAMEFMRREFHDPDFYEGWFDAIHASPPCQAYSEAQRLRGNDHPDLIAAARELLEDTGLPYVIENVKGAPLNNPCVLEGQMFALNTHRPRYFETNWALLVPTMRLARGAQAKMGRRPLDGESIQVVGNFSDVEAGRKAMGIDWMTRDELKEAIPPAYTEFIGHQLMQQLQRRAA